MKKLLVTMLTILSCGAAFALPVGNPSEASFLCDGLIWEGHCGCDPCDPCLTWCDAFSVRFGFYGDYVFNRHLKNRSSTASNRHQLDHSHINTNAGYVALNFWDRFDFFATLGNSNLWLEGNISSFGPNIFGVGGPRITIETSTDFSWSVGGRATLWECGCTALGLEGQYFRADPRVKSVIFEELATVNPSSTAPHLHAQYSEWQVGVGLSHRINIFVPYVAVKWSGAHLNWRNANNPFILVPGTTPVSITLNNLRNTNYWGYALGISVVDCEKGALTAEARFGDEKALYVNGQIRF